MLHVRDRFRDDRLITSEASVAATAKEAAQARQQKAKAVAEKEAQEAHLHDGSGGRCSLPVRLPGVLDGFAAHHVVLVVGVRAPLASLEDEANGAVGVELGEELVNEARGRLEAFAVAVDPVPVTRFFGEIDRTWRRGSFGTAGRRRLQQQRAP